MIAIICIEERGGMAFAGKRFTKDAKLRRKILETVGDQPLYMNAYSAKQFGENLPGNICVCGDYLKYAPENAYCFIETEAPSEWLRKADKLILFSWNRRYPYDVFFDRDCLQLMKRIEEETEEFAGSSHENITKEVYVK